MRVVTAPVDFDIAGCVTLINIEWPTNCYSTIGGVGSCLTIIGPEVPELNWVRPKFGLFAFDSELPSAVKNHGCSFGLQTAPFGVPQTGQACVGIVGMLIATATPVASTDYRSNIDGRITVAGGTGVSISILDDYGNTIQSGLSGLTTKTGLTDMLAASFILSPGRSASALFCCFEGLSISDPWNDYIPDELKRTCPRRRT